MGLSFKGSEFIGFRGFEDSGLGLKSFIRRAFGFIWFAGSVPTWFP